VGKGIDGFYLGEGGMPSPNCYSTDLLPDRHWRVDRPYVDVRESPAVVEWESE